MHNIETFHNEKIVVAENVGFRIAADLSNQYITSRALVVMDNIETFHNNNIVVAENVGFRFEADLFKSVQMILDVRCHGQH